MKIEPKSIDQLDEIWVYKNFLDLDIFYNLKMFVEGISSNTVHNYENRKLEIENKTYTLINTKDYRPYHKLWQLYDLKGYWDQNNETIYNWANSNYNKIIPPMLRFLGEKILQLYPLNKNRYIMTRGIFNILEPGIALDFHIDEDSYCTTGETMSATFYIKNDGEGGEFYDERGLFYKPEINSVLINIGNKYSHGVAPSTEQRLGLTFRFVQPKDLLLPGSIEDLLYKP
jgi:hypothetical protein